MGGYLNVPGLPMFSVIHRGSPACGCEVTPSACCPKTSSPTLNSTFICALSFRTSSTSSIAPRGSCAQNGRYFYRTLYGHYRHACRLSNTKGIRHDVAPHAHPTLRSREGRKAREQSYVQHPDNIGIT